MSRSDPHARRVIHLEDARLVSKALAEGKSATEDPGFIEGYLATWDNVDRQGEVISKGAFSRTINGSVAAGKVKLMCTHVEEGGDALETIGTITQAREDDIGLWIHADLSPDPIAQAIRSKAVSGHIKGLSVAFFGVHDHTETRNDKIVRVYTECRLLEGTVTNHPVNTQAGITRAKSENQNFSSGQSADNLRDTGAAASGSTAAQAPAATAVKPHAATLRAKLALARARARAS